MNLFYFSILLTIIANLLYHLFQKNINPEAHPIISIIATYLAAIIFSLVILPFFPIQTNLVQSIKSLNWASIALGLALVGFEIGYLLAYRAGWNISVASLYVNVTIALILVPVGLWFFQEQLTWQKGLGIVMCVVGIFLIGK